VASLARGKEGKGRGGIGPSYRRGLATDWAGIEEGESRCLGRNFSWR
jgi:hypothetical protein